MHEEGRKLQQSNTTSHFISLCSIQVDLKGLLQEFTSSEARSTLTTEEVKYRSSAYLPAGRFFHGPVAHEPGRVVGFEIPIL